MSGYLDEIAARQEKECATSLLYELKTAFEEALAREGAQLPVPMRNVYDLLRFTFCDSIAHLLRDEPKVIRQAQTFAKKHGAKKLAAILADALKGRPQPKISLIANLFGDKKKLEIETPEFCRFDGKDWGSTDIAISLAMDDFEHALLNEVLAQLDAITLQAPLAHRQQAGIDATIAAKLAQTGDAKTPFLELVSGKNCRMLADSYEKAELRDIDNAQVFPVTHVVYSPVPAETLARLAKQYGPVADALLAVYACHDGAELFTVAGKAGFHLAPIGKWDGLKERAISWAEKVTWQDNLADIPIYLRTAIAFGNIPYDSEYWLLITEGKHAGKIMLSDTDLIDDTPRFQSLADFFATLLLDPARILNSGGYVRYQSSKNEDLFPIAYRYD